MTVEPHLREIFLRDAKELTHSPSIVAQKLREMLLRAAEGEKMHVTDGEYSIFADADIKGAALKSSPTPPA